MRMILARSLGWLRRNESKKSHAPAAGQGPDDRGHPAPDRSLHRLGQTRPGRRVAKEARGIKAVGRSGATTSTRRRDIRGALEPCREGDSNDTERVRVMEQWHYD